MSKRWASSQPDPLLQLEVWPGVTGAEGLQCSSPRLLPLSRPSPFPLSLPAIEGGSIP